MLFIYPFGTSLSTRAIFCSAIKNEKWPGHFVKISHNYSVGVPMILPYPFNFVRFAVLLNRHKERRWAKEHKYFTPFPFSVPPLLKNPPAGERKAPTAWTLQGTVHPSLFMPCSAFSAVPHLTAKIIYPYLMLFSVKKVHALRQEL